MINSTTRFSLSNLTLELDIHISIVMFAILLEAKLEMARRTNEKKMRNGMGNRINTVESRFSIEWTKLNNRSMTMQPKWWFVLIMRKIFHSQLLVLVWNTINVNCGYTIFVFTILFLVIHRCLFIRNISQAIFQMKLFQYYCAIFQIRYQQRWRKVYIFTDNCAAQNKNRFS